MGRGGPFTALFGLFTGAVLFALHIVYWVLIVALTVAAILAYGTYKAVRALYRKFRKPREVEPRPVTPPVKPGPGPRDWSPRE